MTKENGQQERAGFKSRIGFVLAAAGSAVGLGNIWKFPYITGENGGGLFVLIYLVCIVLVGLPIMVAEIMIGRAAQKQPVAAFHVLQGKQTPWASVGWLGVFTGFVILSYYVVVAGWAMDYTLKSVVNFTQPIHKDAELEAAKFCASTKADMIREYLVEQRVEKRSKPRTNAIWSELKPSVRREYERYEAATSDWEEKKGGTPGQFVFANTITLEEQHEAEQARKEMNHIREQERAAAESYYAKLNDEQLYRDAEVLKRREVTFAKVEKTFNTLASDGWTSTFWTALFMFSTVIIVARGISGGIERTCQILMPTMFILILIMVIYGTTKPGFGQAFAFVFQPDPSKLKVSGVLEALGHAFFTLSLGMGAMITYGSYQKSKGGLVSQSLTIASVDTLIALMACLMMFPIIFSYGQEPSAGPGLVFKSMPLAFSEMGAGGMLLAIMFFGLLCFAALTSAISLLEVVASYFIDEHNWPRQRAAWTLGGIVFLFALPSAFSNDPKMLMSGWQPSFGKNFFDTMDYLASNWMLPLGGLLIAIYAGWVMPPRLRRAEFAGIPNVLFRGWLFLICIVAPALVVLILLQKVGILDVDELFYGLF